MGLGKQEEVGVGAHLVAQRDFLAIAQGARRAGKRCGLLHGRIEGVVVRHDASLTHTRPQLLAIHGKDTARHHRDTEVVGRVLCVVAIEVRRERCLVRQDEHRAEAGELLRNRRDKLVAHQNVLVLFLDDFKACRRHDFHHVLTRGEHRVAIIRVRNTDGAIGGRWATGGRTAIGHGREHVVTVVGRRLDLVEHAPPVKALELCVVGERMFLASDRILGVEPHLRAL